MTEAAPPAEGPSLPARVSLDPALGGVQLKQPAFTNLSLLPRFEGGILLKDRRHAVGPKALARLLDAGHKRAVGVLGMLLMITATVVTDGALGAILGWAFLLPVFALLLLPATRWDGVMLELHPRHAVVMTPYSHRPTRRVPRLGLRAATVPGAGDKFHVEVVTLADGRHTVAWQLGPEEAMALVDLVNAYAAAAPGDLR